MKAKDEKEIDETVIAQANEKTAWTDFQAIKKRVERGNRDKFFYALSEVPKVEPDEDDRFD